MFGHLPSPLFHASSLLPNEIARECWRLWECDPNKSCKAMLGNQKRIERNVLAPGVNLLAAEHHMHQFQFLPFARCLRITLLLLQARVIPSSTCMYAPFMSNVSEFQRTITTKVVLSYRPGETIATPVDLRKHFLLDPIPQALAGLRKHAAINMQLESNEYTMKSWNHPSFHKSRSPKISLILWWSFIISLLFTVSALSNIYIYICQYISYIYNAATWHY